MSQADNFLSLSLSVPHTHYILHCVFIILISVVVVVDPLNFSGFRNVGGGKLNSHNFLPKVLFFRPRPLAIRARSC